VFNENVFEMEKAMRDVEMGKDEERKTKKKIKGRKNCESFLPLNEERK